MLVVHQRPMHIRLFVASSDLEEGSKEPTVKGVTYDPEHETVNVGYSARHSFTCVVRGHT